MSPDFVIEWIFNLLGEVQVRNWALYIDLSIFIIMRFFQLSRSNREKPLKNRFDTFSNSNGGYSSSNKRPFLFESEFMSDLISEVSFQLSLWPCLLWTELLNAYIKLKKDLKKKLLHQSKDYILETTFGF